MALTRDDLKNLAHLLQDDLELKLEIAEQILDDVVVSRLMERNARLRETFRRSVLTEELMRLPERFQKFEQETGERLTRVEQRLTRVEQEVAEVKQELAETKQGVQSLQDWRRGEEARRAGEEYEREIVRRAARIFGAGEGGSPAHSERVSQQVAAWLNQAGIYDEDIPEGDDPLDADLIWWKGNRVALAEISIKVDKDDVLRAQRRAAVLSQAGLEVLPVVIGSEWAHPETQQLAEQQGVAWRIGNAFSEGIVAFRRIAHP
ncbi:MAG: hypothetical protein NZ556_04640 [Fimbriimonadales bacterium]|nr:hypothetical protein [Fimbriimonadales bacterium]